MNIPDCLPQVLTVGEQGKPVVNCRTEFFPGFIRLEFFSMNLEVKCNGNAEQIERLSIDTPAPVGGQVSVDSFRFGINI